MEQTKQIVHMSRTRLLREMQTVIDEDRNVPDSKPDIDRIIVTDSEITGEVLKNTGQKLLIRGKVVYRLLYGSSILPGEVHLLSGEIPFEEICSVEGGTEEQVPFGTFDFDDFSINLINSRKYCVKAVIDLSIWDHSQEETGIPTDLVSQRPVEKLRQVREAMDIRLDTRDVFRVKEELTISQAKPNMGSILWEQAQLGDFEAVIVDQRIKLSGQISLFLLYDPLDEEAPNQWLETSIPVKGTLEPSGLDRPGEDLISHIWARLGKCDLTIKNDEDGEPRMIGVDASLELVMKVYEECKIGQLEDVYATDRKLIPVRSQEKIYRFVMKNSSRVKVMEKISLDQEEETILSVCSAKAHVKLDSVEPTEDGLDVTGVLQGVLIYISSNDIYPIMSAAREIPFEHHVEVGKDCRGCVYEIQDQMETVSANMTGSGEVELKASFTLQALVLEQVEIPVITSLEEEELDPSQLYALPGMTGYLVQEGDTLWKIARENYTTVEDIMNINALTSQDLQEGDKIIFMKQNF